MPSHEREIGVQMGRFCPYTLGHALMTDQLVQDFGDDSLLILGSHNAFRWPDIPFTPEQRIDLIGKSTAHAVEICGLDDSNPHDKTAWNLPKWWESLRTLEQQRNASFVFYGGSDDDLKYHKEGGFKTHVAVDRVTTGKSIAATEVRQLLGTILHARSHHDDVRAANATERIDEIMAPAAVESALEYLRQNIRLLSARLQQDLLAAFAPSSPSSHEQH